MAFPARYGTEHLVKFKLSASGNGKGGEGVGGIRTGRHCAGAAFGGAKTWNSEILHPQLSVLFKVRTNAVVVAIRITILEI